MSSILYNNCHTMVGLSDKIQKKSPTKLQDRVREFLDKQIKNKEFVFNDTKIKDRRVREYLKSNDLLYSPCKYVYILKDRTKTNKEVLDQNYFNIVAQLGKGSVVGGELALNYHLGKTAKVNEIDIITPHKNGEIQLGGDDTYIVRYTKSEKYRELQKVTINNAKVFVETPTSYLANNFTEENTKNEDFKLLLNSTNFMLGDVQKFIEKGGSVSSLSRMALYYKENKNPRNFTLIKTALQKSGKSLNYNVGSKEDSSDALNELLNTSLEYNTEPTPEVSPKIARFEQYISKLDKQCDEVLERHDLSEIKFKPLDTLLNDIEANVVHDSYNSLTIEGYNVSREEIELLKDPEHHEKEVENIEHKLDVKGYFEAFRTTVDQIKIDYGYGTKINKNFMIDINSKLFKYESEAKGFDIQGDYREHNVQISGAKHLPPSHELVPEQMDLFLDYVNNIPRETTADVIKKAVMTHFLFVYIHPFGDGNGRTGRFLMNHALGSEKLDWITILSDRKKEYIDALATASEKEDISEFTNLIVHYLK